MFDGLVALAMDRWRHECGAKGANHITSGSSMSEGRFVLSTFRSERTNEASTLNITPKRSSSRDVARRHQPSPFLVCVRLRHDDDDAGRHWETEREAFLHPISR
ncbi:hypothetical protein TNCV_3889901 [Trichonephila clavipes]|nr:hypothetical protein TNCV_3889901 [Trichonephila clavipes]